MMSKLNFSDYDSVNVLDSQEEMGPQRTSSSISDVCKRTSAFCRLDDRDTYVDSENRASEMNEGDNEVECQMDEAGDIIFGSQEFFCTPDFVTPVENQFQLGFRDASSEDSETSMPLPSPASSTPMKQKRTRVSERIAARMRWSDPEVLSNSPEPPALQLPSRIKKLSALAASLAANRDQPDIIPGPDNSQEAGKRRDKPPPVPRSGSIPPFSGEPRLDVPAGGHHLKGSMRERMRRGAQSPPCLKNPFLKEEEEDVDLGTKRRKTLTSRSAYAGAAMSPTAHSHYREEFKEIEEIGKGNFSRVFKVKKRLDGCLYAVKKSVRPFRNENERAQYTMEVQALAAVGAHSNIVRYFHSWCENGHLYIQMELCNGSVAELQKSRQVFPEAQLVDFIRQMSSALSVIHAKGIAHLDVKPDNIYTVNSSYRLGDFGRAAKLDGTSTVEEGDVRYVPLEILNSDFSDLAKVDMFSLGASVYELARHEPLPSSGVPFQEIRRGNLAPLPGFSDLFQGLIKDLLHPDPRMRPSADEVLCHPLLE